MVEVEVVVAVVVVVVVVGVVGAENEMAPRWFAILLNTQKIIIQTHIFTT